MICICIGNTGYQAVLEKAKSEELIELRLDQLKITDEEIETICSQLSRTIISYHPGKTGDSERMNKLKTAILAGAEFVDIEWDADEEFIDEIVPFARGNDCRVIISFYDTEKTPVKRELEHIVRECSMQGADIIKIVCRVNSIEDNARLLSLYSLGKNIISLGLGRLGSITRIVAPLAGAEFTYAYLGKDIDVDGGQMKKAEIEHINKLLKLPQNNPSGL